MKAENACGKNPLQSARDTYFQVAELLPRGTIVLLATRCHLALHALQKGEGSAATAEYADVKTRGDAQA